MAKKDKNISMSDQQLQLAEQKALQAENDVKVAQTGIFQSVTPPKQYFQDSPGVQSSPMGSRFSSSLSYAPTLSQYMGDTVNVEKAIMNLEQQYDAAQQAIGDAVNIGKVLNPDVIHKKERLDFYNGEIDKIAENEELTNRQKYIAIDKLHKNFKSDEKILSMYNNRRTRAEYHGMIDEMVKKGGKDGGLDSYTAENLKRIYDQQYAKQEGVGADGNDLGAYGMYDHNTPAAYVDMTEKVNDAVKNWASDQKEIASASASSTGNGYIVTYKGSDRTEYIPFAEVYNRIKPMLENDPMVKAFLNQEGFIVSRNADIKSYRENLNNLANTDKIDKDETDEQASLRKAKAKARLDMSDKELRREISRDVVEQQIYDSANLGAEKTSFKKTWQDRDANRTADSIWIYRAKLAREREKNRPRNPTSTATVGRKTGAGNRLQNLKIGKDGRIIQQGSDSNNFKRNVLKIARGKQHPLLNTPEYHTKNLYETNALLKNPNVNKFFEFMDSGDIENAKKILLQDESFDKTDVNEMVSSYNAHKQSSELMTNIFGVATTTKKDPNEQINTMYEKWGGLDFKYDATPAEKLAYVQEIDKKNNERATWQLSGGSAFDEKLRKNFGNFAKIAAMGEVFYNGNRLTIQQFENKLKEDYPTTYGKADDPIAAWQKDISTKGGFGLGVQNYLESNGKFSQNVGTITVSLGGNEVALYAEDGINQTFSPIAKVQQDVLYNVDDDIRETKGQPIGSTGKYLHGKVQYVDGDAQLLYTISDHENRRAAFNQDTGFVPEATVGTILLNKYVHGDTQMELNLNTTKEVVSENILK